MTVKHWCSMQIEVSTTRSQLGELYENDGVQADESGWRHGLETRAALVIQVSPNILPLMLSL
jgi:hypothetical protein